MIVYEMAIFILIGSWIKNKWLGYFLLWSVVGLYLNYSKFIFFATFTIAIYLIVYNLLVELVKKKPLSFWLDCVCLSALLQLPLCALQFHGIDPIFAPIGTPERFTFSGFLDNPTFLSAYMVICMPAFFRGWKKWLIPLLLIPIIVNFSTMSIIALIGMLTLYFLVKFPKRVTVLSMIALFLIAINCVMYFDPQAKRMGSIKRRVESMTTWEIIKFQTSGRADNWKRSFDLVKDSPKKMLMGIGQGRFKLIYNLRYGPSTWLVQVHNAPLQLLIEGGTIACYFIFGYLISLWRKFWKYRREMLLPACGFMAFFINSCGNFPERIPPLAVAALLFAALIESNYGKNRIQDQN